MRPQDYSGHHKTLSPYLLQTTGCVWGHYSAAAAVLFSSSAFHFHRWLSVCLLIFLTFVIFQSSLNLEFTLRKHNRFSSHGSSMKVIFMQVWLYSKPAHGSRDWSIFLTAFCSQTKSSCFHRTQLDLPINYFLMTLWTEETSVRSSFAVCSLFLL